MVKLLLSQGDIKINRLGFVALYTKRIYWALQTCSASFNLAVDFTGTPERPTTATQIPFSGRRSRYW